MYKITRSFFTLIALLVLFSTSAGTAFAKQAKWTVMVYMSGDNNLEDYVVKDIEEELGLVGSNADIKILALADRGPGYDTSRGDWQTTKLFKVKQGMKANSSEAVADWGERDMGDPQTLIDFVIWSKKNYPAAHYALYFWGHSWNWEPGWTMRDYTTNHDTLDYDTLDYGEIKAALKFHTPLIWTSLIWLASMAATWHPLRYINFGRDTPLPSLPQRTMSIGTASNMMLFSLN